VEAASASRPAVCVQGVLRGRDRGGGVRARGHGVAAELRPQRARLRVLHHRRRLDPELHLDVHAGPDGRRRSRLAAAAAPVRRLPAGPHVRTWQLLSARPSRHLRLQGSAVRSSRVCGRARGHRSLQPPPRRPQEARSLFLNPEQAPSHHPQRPHLGRPNGPQLQCAIPNPQRARIRLGRHLASHRLQVLRLLPPRAQQRVRRSHIRHAGAQDRITERPCSCSSSSIRCLNIRSEARLTSRRASYVINSCSFHSSPCHIFSIAGHGLEGHYS
jgi:hypothetical protein